MTTEELVSDPNDVAYVEANYMRLSSPDPTRPKPSYTMMDGTHYVPLDYYEQELDRERFIARYRSAARQLGLDSKYEDGVGQWDAFMTGMYGVCLRSPSPENIARKGALMNEIDSLLAMPNIHSAMWLNALRDAVDSLDELEMPFSPVLDRQRFGGPPSRDTYITNVRASYLTSG